MIRAAHQAGKNVAQEECGKEQSRRKRLAPSRSLDERDDGGLDGWIGQLAALLEISEALLSTRELPVVLQLIASSVCHLVGVRRSAIFTYEAASDTFQGIAAHELDAAAIQAISERAADVLRTRGFRVAVVGSTPYPGVGPGIVIRQGPQAGFQIGPDEPISFEISR